MQRQTKISLHAPRGIQAAKHGLQRKESWRLSKSFICDPLFLSSKNGHKNHLRKFWSEKRPFFAIWANI